MNSNNESLKRILKKYNLKAKKRFGQNFLTDQSVLERIVSSAGQLENKSILEIGGCLLYTSPSPRD